MSIHLKTLGGGRGSLRSDAAESIARIDKGRKSKGRLPISSAYRSPAEQEQLKRWWSEGRASRLKHGLVFQPAWYPPYPHSSGLFVDVATAEGRLWMNTWGRAHGWRRTVPADVVHFGYFPHLDKKKPKKQTGPAVLKFGSHGDRVQRVRRALGFKAGSFFGMGTRDAVQQFQRKHDLTPDGRVGPLTWAALGLGAWT